MTINFKLKDIDYHFGPGDPMARDWTGFSPHLSDHQIYENNRGVWVLGPRADRERYATFSYDGVVKVVVEIRGIETIAGSARRPAQKDRRAITGRVLSAGHTAYDTLISQPVDTDRNPVTYYADPDGRLSTCGCGCGCEVTGSRVFVSGHDQRAVHDRITRRWGSTLKFIEWFDGADPAASTSTGVDEDESATTFTVDDAVTLARQAHEGQTDKAGLPYIDHPLRVMSTFSNNWLRMIAVLHDVLEDTPLTVDDLLEVGCPRRVVTAVEALSRRPREQPEDYLRRVAANPLALRVKRADIADNTRPDRLQALDTATQDRLRAKYRKALALLSQYASCSHVP